MPPAPLKVGSPEEADSPAPRSASILVLLWRCSLKDWRSAAGINAIAGANNISLDLAPKYFFLCEKIPYAREDNKGISATREGFLYVCIVGLQQ